MSVRQLCIQTGKRPAKALFFFPQEGVTGIAATRLIVEKELHFTVGMLVTVNWGGKKADGEILALDGKFDRLYFTLLRVRVHSVRLCLDCLPTITQL